MAKSSLGLITFFQFLNFLIGQVDVHSTLCEVRHALCEYKAKLLPSRSWRFCKEVVPTTGAVTPASGVKISGQRSCYFPRLHKPGCAMTQAREIWAIVAPFFFAIFWTLKSILENMKHEDDSTDTYTSTMSGIPLLEYPFIILIADQRNSFIKMINPTSRSSLE